MALGREDPGDDVSLAKTMDDLIADTSPPDERRHDIARLAAMISREPAPFEERLAAARDLLARTRAAVDAV